MNNRCPNSKCKNYQKTTSVVKSGKYKRKSDSKWIQKYLCKACNKGFSASTGSLSYRQKKRRINSELLELYVSGMSLRRIAIKLKVHRNTVTKRLEYLEKKAMRAQNKLLKSSSFEHIQMDELITIEHTKLKPLSVPTIVDKKTRKILAIDVCQIPAFGLLAKKSVAKYGYRKNKLKESLLYVLNTVRDSITLRSIIDTDEHKLYPEAINKVFPDIRHNRYKGRRGCVVGQGELKSGGFDPLFSINHTLAMLRANVNRLFRRSWNTTKDPRMLLRHLRIYMVYHNQVLTEM